MTASPTPYPEVNAVLLALLEQVRAALGGRFLGMYLYGSLASGGFDPARSDIDFSVVTDGALAPQEIAALERIHAAFAASESRWAHKLEGAYVPLDALQGCAASDAPFPCVNEGQFYLAPLGSDWTFQRYVLREQAVVLAGEHPSRFLEPILPDDLRRAAAAYLREWWQPMLTDPRRLETAEYRAYAVLSMCRTGCTLETGQFVSKPQAAAWALERLEPGWHSLVQQALAWQPGGQMPPASEAQALIRLMLAWAEAA